MEPLRKALRLPRVNLFIADDTGLGKTIEAGLIARELLLRKKAKTIVVAAPPSVLAMSRLPPRGAVTAWGPTPSACRLLVDVGVSNRRLPSLRSKRAHRPAPRPTRSCPRCRRDIPLTCSSERADQREVEESLSLGADRLRVDVRRLELGDHGAAVVQEREEPLHEGYSARSGLLTHGDAHGSRDGRPVQCSAHVQNPW
jgi:hypothetical protein